MPKFAIIENNEIKNVIVADTLEIAETATNALCVELPESGIGIGDLWNGIEFTRFTPKEPEVNNA